jgi:hypothetical protein
MRRELPRRFPPPTIRWRPLSFASKYPSRRVFPHLDQLRTSQSTPLPDPPANGHVQLRPVFHRVIDVRKGDRLVMNLEIVPMSTASESPPRSPVAQPPAARRLRSGRQIASRPLPWSRSSATGLRSWTRAWQVAAGAPVIAATG